MGLIMLWFLNYEPGAGTAATSPAAKKKGGPGPISKEPAAFEKALVKQFPSLVDPVKVISVKSHFYFSGFTSRV
jgi:hypothetical protein